MSSQTMPDRSYDNRANVYALSHKICNKSGTCTSQLWVPYCPYINPIVQCPFVVDNQLKVINKTFKDFLTGSYLSECSIAQNMLTTPNFVKSCVYSQRSKTFVWLLILFLFLITPYYSDDRLCNHTFLYFTTQPKKQNWWH